MTFDAENAVGDRTDDLVHRANLSSEIDRMMAAFSGRPIQLPGANGETREIQFLPEGTPEELLEVILASPWVEKPAEMLVRNWNQVKYSQKTKGVELITEDYGSCITLLCDVRGYTKAMNEMDDEQKMAFFDSILARMGVEKDMFPGAKVVQKPAGDAFALVIPFSSREEAQAIVQTVDGNKHKRVSMGFEEGSPEEAAFVAMDPERFAGGKCGVKYVMDLAKPGEAKQAIGVPVNDLGVAFRIFGGISYQRIEEAEGGAEVGVPVQTDELQKFLTGETELAFSAPEPADVRAFYASLGDADKALFLRKLMHLAHSRSGMDLLMEPIDVLARDVDNVSGNVFDVVGGALVANMLSPSTGWISPVDRSLENLSKISVLLAQFLEDQPRYSDIAKIDGDRIVIKQKAQPELAMDLYFNMARFLMKNGISSETINVSIGYGKSMVLNEYNSLGAASTDFSGNVAVQPAVLNKKRPKNRFCLSRDMALALFPDVEMQKVLLKGKGVLIQFLECDLDKLLEVSDWRDLFPARELLFMDATNEVWKAALAQSNFISLVPALDEEFRSGLGGEEREELLLQRGFGLSAFARAKRRELVEQGEQAEILFPAKGEVAPMAASFFRRLQALAGEDVDSTKLSQEAFIEAVQSFVAKHPIVNPEERITFFLDAESLNELDREVLPILFAALGPNARVVLGESFDGFAEVPCWEKKLDQFAAMMMTPLASVDIADRHTFRVHLVNQLRMHPEFFARRALTPRLADELSARVSFDGVLIHECKGEVDPYAGEVRVNFEGAKGSMSANLAALDARLNTPAEREIVYAISMSPFPLKEIDVASLVDKSWAGVEYALAVLHAKGVLARVAAPGDGIEVKGERKPEMLYSLVDGSLRKPFVEHVYANRETKKVLELKGKVAGLATEKVDEMITDTSRPPTMEDVHHVDEYLRLLYALESSDMALVSEHTSVLMALYESRGMVRSAVRLASEAGAYLLARESIDLHDYFFVAEVATVLLRHGNMEQVERAEALLARMDLSEVAHDDLRILKDLMAPLARAAKMNRSMDGFKSYPRKTYDALVASEEDRLRLFELDATNRSGEPGRYEVANAVTKFFLLHLQEGRERMIRDDQKTFRDGLLKDGLLRAEEGDSVDECELEMGERFVKQLTAVMGEGVLDKQLILNYASAVSGFFPMEPKYSVDAKKMVVDNVDPDVEADKRLSLMALSRRVKLSIYPPLYQAFKPIVSVAKSKDKSSDFVQSQFSVDLYSRCLRAMDVSSDDEVVQFVVDVWRDLVSVLHLSGAQGDRVERTNGLKNAADFVELVSVLALIGVQGIESCLNGIRSHFDVLERELALRDPVFEQNNKSTRDAILGACILTTEEVSEDIIPVAA